jgi:hypothetical protein
MSFIKHLTALIPARFHPARQSRLDASLDTYSSRTSTVGRRSAIGIAAIGAGGALWSMQETNTASAQDATSPGPSSGRINIRAFGAKGDRRTDDLGAIRKAIVQAEQTDQYPASVFIPTGNFRRSDSIALPNQTCLFGEGVSSILNSQNDTEFNKPILVNKSAAGLIAARIQDLTLYGGSHGLQLDAEQENADLRLHNVGMLLQSVANIEVNKLFQTVKISNCVFGSAPYGIRVTGTGTNCLLATGSEWLDHSEGAIFLRGADGVTIVGGRFEGGGRPGRACIDIENATNILFLGCFFENVHETLARFRGITGAIVFQSCHFSGTNLGNGVLRAFRWDIGQETVLFRDCISVQPMPVDGHVMLEGSNPGIFARQILVQGTQQAGRLLVQPGALATDQRAITIDAVGATGDWRLNGHLTLYPAASGDTTQTISITVTPASRDIVLAASPRKVRLVRTGSGRWMIAIAPIAGMTTHSGYAFSWDVLAQGAQPTIRVPLT